MEGGLEVAEAPVAMRLRAGPLGLTRMRLRAEPSIFRSCLGWGGRSYARGWLG